MKIITRAAVARITVLFAVLGALGLWAWSAMLRMPGESLRGSLDPLTSQQRATAQRLRADVERLAHEPRNLTEPASLARAEAWVGAQFEAAGLAVTRHRFNADGYELANVVATLEGNASEQGVIVVGAHYDSAEGTPGANDNASGVAMLLTLSRDMAQDTPGKTVRFVAFANEEPPFFQNEGMGSLAYARSCRERGDRIEAMLSIETVGFFTHRVGSQRYPLPLGWFYPDTGNFIGFVGNFDSRALVRRAVGSFRGAASFPSEGAALPGTVQGVGWSDHWSFWEAGYRALMVTDTAPFRYPHYHRPADTPDKLDYESMSRVATGLAVVVRELASAD